MSLVRTIQQNLSSGFSDEISDLGSRGIVYMYVAKTMALINYAVCAADLHLCFCIC